MMKPKYVLLGLTCLAFTATAEAVSGRLGSSDIVIRTDLENGQIEQRNEGGAWTELADADRALSSEVLSSESSSELGTLKIIVGGSEESAEIEKATFEPRFRRPFYGPRAFYGAPPCGVPGPGFRGGVPCGHVPGYLIVPPVSPQHYYYERGPAFRPGFRISPHRAYRNDGFYYQHFRRW